MFFAALERFTAAANNHSLQIGLNFQMLLRICKCKTKISLDMNISTKVDFTDLFHYLL